MVTNDLTQYTLIAGRDNATVRDYYEDTHPSMLRLLGIIIAEEAGLDLRRARGSRGSHPNANGNRLPCAQYFPSADLDNERANQIDWHQKTCEPTLIEFAYSDRRNYSVATEITVGFYLHSLNAKSRSDRR